MPPSVLILALAASRADAFERNDHFGMHSEVTPNGASGEPVRWWSLKRCERVPGVTPPPPAAPHSECLGVTPKRCRRPPGARRHPSVGDVQLDRRRLFQHSLESGVTRSHSESWGTLAASACSTPSARWYGRSRWPRDHLGAISVSRAGAQLWRVSAALPYHSAMRPLLQTTSSLTAGGSALRFGLSR